MITPDTPTTTAPSPETMPPTPTSELMVGGVNDPAEREADRVADDVVGLIDRAMSAEPPATLTAADTKSGRIRRAVRTESRGAAASAAGGPVPRDIARGFAAQRGGGQPLGASIRTPMEDAFGADLSKVRVHTGTSANRLARSVDASAMTLGSDIFFSEGHFAPQRRAGRRLLAHELTHTLQQSHGQQRDIRRSRRPLVIRRKYVLNKVTSNAHLRDETDWDTTIGSRIDKGRVILAGDPTDHLLNKKVDLNANTKHTTKMTMKGPKREEVMWRPAINVPLEALPRATIAGGQKGYIRAASLKPLGDADGVEAILKDRVIAAIQRAERNHPALRGKLFDPTNATHTSSGEEQGEVEHLVSKNLRPGNISGHDPDRDARAFSDINARLARVRIAARETASAIEHWRTWIYDDPSKVSIELVDYTHSDIHMRGLGVVRVKFKKPAGGNNQMFPGTNPDVIIKPEDKALETALIGSDPNKPMEKSAATEINQAVGIDTDPTKALTTIKMYTDTVHGAIIERVKGTPPEKMNELVRTAGYTVPAVTDSFHETMIFAFLTGMEDLHKQNVMWSDDGRPFLIDADNVLDRSQMTQTGKGQESQSGFTMGSDERKAAATATHSAIGAGTNPMNSKILEAMLDKTSSVARDKIIAALRKAVQGKTARVVPIGTATWGGKLTEYLGMTDAQKDALVNDAAKDTYLVRKGVPYKKYDPSGLWGVAGENAAGYRYDEDAEKAKLHDDFRNGVIPFYEYHFDSGNVTHNGTVIYHGAVATAALQIVIDKFAAHRA